MRSLTTFLLPIPLLAQGIPTKNFKTPEAAYSCIMSAKEFKTGRVGYAGLIPPEIYATTFLATHPDGKRWLDRLIKEAPLHGQLYALCAFYYASQETFSAILPKYRENKSMVRVMDGCIIHEQPCAEIVFNQDKSTLRLSCPTESLEQCYKRNSKLMQKGFFHDIAGGCLPALFKELTGQ